MIYDPELPNRGISTELVFRLQVDPKDQRDHGCMYRSMGSTVYRIYVPINDGGIYDAIIMTVGRESTGGGTFH